MIPVVLFAYARPGHLSQVLNALQTDQVPLIYVFSDGPRTPDKGKAVAEVRELLHAIDWCEVRLTEREQNLGLGRSILSGVSEVLESHNSAIVVEDDLICVPGTYNYLCAALEYYQDDPRVMSVTGWTHPRVTPPELHEQPYFDGRAECWIWGTWARAWQGMDRPAAALMHECRAKGLDIYRYGADLEEMAQKELKWNIWAVRFLYWHILNGGLCLRPPHSMVEHIGFDHDATFAQEAWGWDNPPLRSVPPLPGQWPDPVENPMCSELWRRAYGGRPSIARRILRFARNMGRRAIPGLIKKRIRSIARKVDQYL